MSDKPKTLRIPRMFKWTVEVEVSEVWVADGFEFPADPDDCAEWFRERMLGYAYPHEIKARVLKAPNADAVRAVQGGKVEGYGTGPVSINRRERGR